MSSREGIPVEVVIVAGDPEDGRAPGGGGCCFEIVRRLNADIALSGVVNVGGRLEVCFGAHPRAPMCRVGAPTSGDCRPPPCH